MNKKFLFGYISLYLLVCLLSVSIYILEKEKTPKIIEKTNNENFSYETVDWLNSTCISKIMETRIKNGDFLFSFEDAVYMSKKIYEYSSKYNLSHKEGLIIVNIESDFNKNAYNHNGKAYGLCQITEKCLQEYNEKNGTEYNLNDMYNIDLNLDVGFWYYDRILNHYSKYDNYGIILDTREEALRDAYIAYNIGPTIFKNVEEEGREMLRNGIYPKNMYGKKKGDEYKSISRFNYITDKWS